MLAVRLYDSIVALHVISIVVAFGVTFAYPIIFSFLGPNHPQALAPMHEAQERIGKFLITPFAVLALVTGIYLAADADLFGEIWVQVPMGILIVLLGLGGAFFAPNARAMAELARDPARREDYMARVALAKKVGVLAEILVLVAIYFMVAKPGL